jgi:hypothetical protein
MGAGQPKVTGSPGHASGRSDYHNPNACEGDSLTRGRLLCFTSNNVMQRIDLNASFLPAIRISGPILHTGARGRRRLT